MSGRYDFTIKQGSTFSMAVTWKTKNGPVDLAGYTGRMQVRYGNAKGGLAVDLTTDNGGVQIDMFNKQIKIFISAEETANIRATPCVYDLEVVKDDYVERLIEGKIRISEEVTK